MRLTRDDAIMLVCEWLSYSDPIDTKRLKKDFNPVTTTFLHGHLVDRPVCHAVNALDYWVVTVWPEYKSWKNRNAAKQYKVEWPDSVTETKNAVMSPGIPPRSLYLSISIWWWNALTRLGKKWFKAGFHSRSAKHLLMSGVLKELVRYKIKNPAVYARPNVDGKKLSWIVADPFSDTTYGEGHHEIDAWQAAAMECGIKVPIEKSRPGRAPVRLKVPPTVNLTQ